MSIHTKPLLTNSLTTIHGTVLQNVKRPPCSDPEGLSITLIIFHFIWTFQKLLFAKSISANNHVLVTIQRKKKTHPHKHKRVYTQTTNNLFKVRFYYTQCPLHKKFSKIVIFKIKIRFVYPILVVQ